MFIRFFDLFHSSIREEDNKDTRQKIFIYNQYLFVTFLIFLFYSFTFIYENKVHLFFYILIICSFLFLISIFRRTKLKKAPVFYFFIFLVVSIYLSLDIFGPLTGNGFLYASILSALPLFFSWKEHKHYYLIIAGLVFLGIVFPFYFKPNLKLVDAYYIKTIDNIGVSLQSMCFGAGFCLNNIYFINKINKIKGEKKDIIKNQQIISPHIKDDPLLLHKFKECYPILSENLLKKIPDLTPTDFRFLILIYFQMSSKQMAEYLNLTYRTIQTKKNKLRRKLNLGEGADLYGYIKMIEQEQN